MCVFVCLTNRENNLSNEYITLDLGFASVAGDVWGAMFRGFRAIDV